MPQVAQIITPNGQIQQVQIANLSQLQSLQVIYLSINIKHFMCNFNTSYTHRQKLIIILGKSTNKMLYFCSLCKVNK